MLHHKSNLLTDECKVEKFLLQGNFFFKDETPSTKGSNAKMQGQQCLFCYIKKLDSTNKLERVRKKRPLSKVCTCCLRKRGEDENAHLSKCKWKFKSKDGNKSWNVDCCKGCASHNPNNGINQAVCFCKTKTEPARCTVMKVTTIKVTIANTKNYMVGRMQTSLGNVLVIKRTARRKPLLYSMVGEPRALVYHSS